MNTYQGHHYKVTDEAITPIGKIETWDAETREQAAGKALYTHQLHNKNTKATPRGVIHCPTCGQIAIVKGN